MPNDWATTTNAQITAVRDNGDSTVNENQLKKVYIDERGAGYSQGTHELDILGDGTGGKVVVDVDSQGRITNTSVSAGGKNYSYGMVDLGSINSNSTTKAKLVPIIPLQKDMDLIFTRNLVQNVFSFMPVLMIQPKISQ